MSGGCEATWPKRGVPVINAPCLGCRQRNETDEGSGWWMRAGARADKTWPMNLFYIIGSFDRWQKFRDGPVHLSKQTKASSLPAPSLTPKHCNHPPPTPSSNTLPLRLALTRKQTAERQKWNNREGMHLRVRWSDKERKRVGCGLEKTARQKERESKVSIRGAWSLWTMAARLKAPQKEPSSAMTDSADKRWSMKADRCADSRREALAPAGRVHYCGQTQLSGPNGPSAFCHATTLTSHSQSQGLSTPCFTPFSHRTLHSSTETFPGQSIAQLHFGVYQLTGVEINLSQQFSDILTMCKGMQGRAEWRISDR